MGRRSINTTKSGKYMNPTDQARKEARKKELKKNKRQRQMVRAAVLKMKDPVQILEELEKIDEMEYNVLQPSPLNEKVLKEKRKKLKETLHRVLKMYDKDEPERWADLKRQEAEYERRRATLAAYHESVRHAQAVQVDDIPLPTLQVPDNLIYGNMPSQIPLPMELTPSIVPMPPPKPTGILKKDTMYKDVPPAMEAPGVPPGPPPNLADYIGGEINDINQSKRLGQKVLRFSDQTESDDRNKMDIDINKDKAMKIYNIEPDERNSSSMDIQMGPPPIYPLMNISTKPTNLQQRMLALSGQNIDEFMKEMEEVHKKRAADITSRLSSHDRKHGDESNSDDDDDQSKERDDRVNLSQLMCPPGTTGIEPSHIMPMRPPPLMGTMLRPPPLRPPGPPPGMPRLAGQSIRGAPPGPPPGPPPRPLRLPPGPPPGLPPRGLPLPRALPHSIQQQQQHGVNAPLPVLSAAPQLINRKDAPQGATIMAKPQIRNLSADVTRFVPSALRIKRDDHKVKQHHVRGPSMDVKKPIETGHKAPGGPTKDDAYMQFMQEMQGLL